MSEQLRKIDSLEALETFLDEEHGGYSAEGIRSNWSVLPTWVPNLSYNTRICDLLAGEIDFFTLPEGLPKACEVTAENYWILREAARFEFGIYRKRMPAHFERLRELRRDLWWHFLHVSVEDPSMVAYTPSHEYGKRDRQVRVKVGKYLTQFYSEHLSPEGIRAVANMCKPHEVKFAVTRREIADVYIHGPHSCMSGDEWGHLHPAMVYEGEFRLAYLETGEQIVARGFVHDPSQTWVRMYGDEGQTLADALTSMGFTRANRWPNGAKLKRIEDGRGRVFMPYIDGGTQSVLACGSHFEIHEDGNYHCTNTSGYIDEDQDECENCGEHYNAEEDGTYSEHHGLRICPSCMDNEFTHARTGRHYHDWVRNDDVVEVDGEYYLNDPEVFAEFDIVECTVSGGYYHIDDMVLTVHDEWVHHTYAVTVGQDEYDETKYAAIGDIDLDYAVYFDPQENTVLALVHPDFGVDTSTPGLFPETMLTLKLRGFLVEHDPREVKWNDNVMPYKSLRFMTHLVDLRETAQRDQAVAA